MRCAVLGCENNEKKINKGNPKLNFYLFPKNDPDLYEKWVQFCRRPKCFKVKSARICGDHFRAKDKERNLKYELGFERAYCPKLRPGAVPCIYKETEGIDRSKNKETLSFFSTVKLKAEQTQAFLCDTGEDRNSNKDPLTLELEKKKLKIPLVHFNGKQTATVHKLNEGTENSQTAFKGILAVLYPVDEAGKPSQGSQEQNFRKQVVNGNSVQTKTLANEDLLHQIRELKKENDKLKKSEEMYKMTIKEMKNKVFKSNYERDNLEEKLKTIFTKNEIRHMKTGKRVIWSVEDMAKAVKLYKTSSAAYKLLKNQNYPFPSQKTVQAWIQMSRKEKNENESETLNGVQKNPTECIDTSLVDKKTAVNKKYNVQKVTERQQMNEFLTFNPANTKQEEISISPKQDTIESKNCSRLSIVEDHSYFLVGD